MEKIYHRKRSQNAIHANNTEIMYLKKWEQGVDGAQTPPLARHELPTSDCTLPSDDTQEKIEVGSVYEIDHTQLPLRTPVQLKSIRVVMVSEKTELNVSVRFPSIESLQRYFSNRTTEMYPELDDRFVMGTTLAEKVLYRKIPSQEFAEKKHSDEFWLGFSNSVSGFGDVISKKAGTCVSELKCNGMVRWGVRRQVRFIGKHKENNNPQSSSSIVRGEEEAKVEANEEEEEEAEEEEDDEEAVTEETNETKQSGKRKRSSRLVRKAKKVKREKRRQINKAKAKNSSKQIAVLKNPQDRWSAERYKLAEKNLLEVMKAKGAVYGIPILRPELRAEARKRIGDTGLLDHLLKHMAGKVAPGGADRFRRRHNAEGAMEYWLESADLVDIRKEAGVQDPYWTPPPGWKQGDCPTQDPICAMELKQLKKETTKLERYMEQMVSKKQMEEELAKLRREMMELLSKKQHEESQAIVVSNPSAISQLDLDTSLVPLKSDVEGSFITLEKYKDQLMFISEYVSRIEEEIGKLKSKVEEGTSLDSSAALMVATECCAEKEKKKVEEEKALLVHQQQEVGTEGVGDQRKTNTAKKEAERTAAEAAAEEKAAKIQRLKSGFRICKPQGTFLWPNMVRSSNTNNTNNTNMLSSSQVVVQVEDLLVVPTPPSVSSSTASAPPQLPFHHSASPVKPLAERRAVTLTVSAVGDTNLSTTTTATATAITTNKKTTTTLINLNDFPTNPPGDGFCMTGTPSSSRQTVTTSTVKVEMGCPWEVVGGKSNGKEMETSDTISSYNQQQQQQQKEEGGCSSTLAAASCLGKGVGISWLALATPIPELDDSTRG